MQMSQNREPRGKTVGSLLGPVESCPRALFFSKLLLKACALGKGVCHFPIVEMEGTGAPAQGGCVDCDTLTVL